MFKSKKKRAIESAIEHLSATLRHAAESLAAVADDVRVSRQEIRRDYICGGWTTPDLNRGLIISKLPEGFNAAIYTPPLNRKRTRLMRVFVRVDGDVLKACYDGVEAYDHHEPAAGQHYLSRLRDIPAGRSNFRIAMRRILLSLLSALLLSGVARAQIPVTDAANITQSIVNSVTELVQTSTTAENMIGNFKETMKIYRQGKEYYDRLRNVTHLVRDARKVQQSILLVGELSDIYVTSYDKMLTDDNFSSAELSAIAAGYNKLMERGMNSLKDLKEIVNPTDYSMTDKERLDRIDQAHGELTHTRDLMVYYTRKNISVSYLRSQRKNDTQRVLDLYGSPDEKYW